MTASKLPALGLGGGAGAAPDPFADPAHFDGVLARRIIAHLLDSLLVYSILAATVLALVLMNIVTLGLFAAPVIGLGTLVPVAYFAAFTGGPQAATPGMRLMGIELRALDGGHPGYGIATLRAVLYYASMALLSPLVLVVALFNDRRRALHDFLSGTVVVNHLVVATA